LLKIYIAKIIIKVIGLQYRVANSSIKYKMIKKYEIDKFIFS
jgi:hypothetical protein